MEDCAETLDDEAVANLKKIESLADKMNTLIEDLLAFSKLKKVEPNKTVVHLNEPLMSVQSDLENYPEIQIEIQSNKLPSVKVDRVRIKEVFLNFVTKMHTSIMNLLIR